MTTLPKAVQQADERADDLINKGLAAQKNSQGNNEHSSRETSEDLDESESAATKDTDLKLEEALQKYRVLQGKYNAELPRMKSANDQLNAQIDVLKTQVGELQKQLTDASEKQDQAIHDSSYLKPLKAEYGDDHHLVTALSEQSKVIQQQRDVITQLNAKLNNLDVRYGDLKGTVENTAKLANRNAESEFFSELSRSVVDWQTINEDPNWLAWLDDVDALSGMSRQSLLDSARSNLDADRVIAFFREYKNQFSKSPGKRTLAPAVERLAQPTNSGVSGAPTDKKLWSREDIQQFYIDNSKGKYSTKEADELDRDILAAQKEGRIR